MGHVKSHVLVQVSLEMLPDEPQIPFFQKTHADLLVEHYPDLACGELECINDGTCIRLDQLEVCICDGAHYGPHCEFLGDQVVDASRQRENDGTKLLDND